MQSSTIVVNLDPLLRSLTTLERKSLPYAQALALNETAFQTKDKLVQKMPSQFDLRSKRPVKGFRVNKAHKGQGVVSASVYHLDAWMGAHETGGTKRPTNGKAMGVPSTETQDKGRAPSGKIRERWWPRNLAKSAGFADPRAAGRMGGRGHKGKGLPKAFLLRSKKGAVSIVRRSTRGGGDGNRFDLVELYHLRKSVEIKPRWEFVDTVELVARVNLAKNFERALFKATAFRG